MISLESASHILTQHEVPSTSTILSQLIVVDDIIDTCTSSQHFGHDRVKESTATEPPMINIEFSSWPRDVAAVPIGQIDLEPDDLLVNYGITFYSCKDDMDRLEAACIRLSNGAAVGLERYDRAPVKGTLLCGFEPIPMFLLPDTLRELGLGWQHVIWIPEKGDIPAYPLKGDIVNENAERLTGAEDSDGELVQDPIEKDPTHDHDEEALDDAAEKFAVERDDDEGEK